MKILIIEYVRPHGGRQRIIHEMDDTYIAEYRKMLEMGRYFTLEKLPPLGDGTHQWSLCVDDGQNDHDIRIINFMLPITEDKIDRRFNEAIEEMLQSYID